jgi:hypothetical protein
MNSNMNNESSKEILDDFYSFLTKIEENKFLRGKLGKEARKLYSDMYRKDDYINREMITKKYRNWKNRLRKKIKSV